MARPISQSVFGRPFQRSPANAPLRQFVSMVLGGANPTTRTTLRVPNAGARATTASIMTCRRSLASPAGYPAGPQLFWISMRGLFHKTRPIGTASRRRPDAPACPRLAHDFTCCSAAFLRYRTLMAPPLMVCGTLMFFSSFDPPPVSHQVPVLSDTLPRRCV
jgi:hypothetical protein